MATPDPSESSPLFNRNSIAGASQQTGRQALLLPLDFVATLVEAPLSLFERLKRNPLALPLRTVIYATITLLIIVSATRRPRVYLSRPRPSADTASHNAQHGSASRLLNRTLSARLLSLNTFIRPVLVGIGDFKDERLADLLPQLRWYDIVCLQELFWATGPRKSAFLKKIAADGLLYQASSPMPGLHGLLQFPPKIIDAGLVILSRYPIVQAEYHTFSRAIFRSIEPIVSKGVLYTRLSLFADKPERYVHVFTMHLQANNGLKNVPFDKVRASQMAEISVFVKRMIQDDPDGVVILAGDFNVDGRAGSEDSTSSEEYKTAVEKLESFRSSTYLKDLLYLANNESHPVTSAGGLRGPPQKKERLDYIFVSSAERDTSDAVLVAEAVPGSVRVEEFRSFPGSGDTPYDTLSDHYGVQAEILFREVNG